MRRIPPLLIALLVLPALVYADKKSGDAKTFYENGQVEWVTHSIDGQLDGNAKRYSRTGALLYEINYKRGKRDGVCTTYYRSGAVASKFNYRNGFLLSDQSFNKNGILSNEFIYFPRTAGEPGPDTNYGRAKFSGISKEYYENGKLNTESVYSDGRLNGISRSYFENGALFMEVGYRSNNVHGIFKTFHQNGDLIWQWNYIDGEWDEKNNTVYPDQGDGIEKFFYQNGSIESEIPYREHKIEGVYKKYFENGKLHWEIHFKNGRPDGPIRDYGEDGALRGEVGHLNGIRQGTLKIYHNGVVAYEGVYEKGKFQKQIKP